MKYPAAALLLTFSLSICCLARPSGAAESLGAGLKSKPLPGSHLELPHSATHPVIACTSQELARLQAAYAATGPEHEVVAAIVKSAQQSIGRPIDFPPRGGQHNQWYQCDKCQIALTTVDAAGHQCPRCKTTYSGQPYDDVIFAKTHSRNLDAMTNAAWTYALTGEEKYAAFAREVLLGYAARYRSYPYHDSQLRTGSKASRSGGHLFEQTLNEASAMASAVAPAYDLVRGSASLSADDHQAIGDGLLRPMLENIAKHKGGKSNWQSWHNAAMLWGGAVLGDEDYVRRAIDDPENGFLHQMQISVSDEGMWYENSWGYHFYTLRALVTTAEGARRLGIDLWSHPVLRKMFVLPVAYAMPDGSLPRYGDDVGTSLDRASGMLEFAYHAYGDPAVLPLLPKRPNWEAVMFGRRASAQAAPDQTHASELFPSAGHAILRTHGEANLAAAITFGPYGGGHGHFDKLSFVLFGYQRELGVDPGRARSQAYRLPIHRQWYKATIGHNAVVVDRASQAPATGKLEGFTANASCAAVIARCDEAYAGVTHRRLLCLMPSYLLVFDELDGSAPRRFDWLYHSRGSAAVCAAAREHEPAGEEYPGWQYVQNVRFGTTDDPVRVRFVDGALTTHLTVAAAPGTEVRTGDGVGASVLERVPLVMVTRRAAQARFAAVLEPLPQDQEPAVASVALQRIDGGTEITVERAGTRDVFLLNAQGELQASSAGKPLLQLKH